VRQFERDEDSCRGGYGPGEQHAHAWAQVLVDGAHYGATKGAAAEEDE
jgi:hypothetical protein